MNPTATPSQMLPPQMVASMVRNGGQPGQMFPQNPLSQGMTPDAMGADPTVMQQPQVGSQAMNPTMPQGQSPIAPQAGQPDQMQGAAQPPQTSEAEMIIKVLGDRLAHHSKITSGTIQTLQKMIEANMPLPDSMGGTPPAA